MPSQKHRAKSKALRGTDHIRRNRALWERTSDAYERAHASTLRVAGAQSWGLFRVPEERLRLLGEVRGQDVLELGCGAALWSIALARRGARCVGIDLSRGHLRHAQSNVQAGSTKLHLIEGNSERLPFPDGRFDLAFCDWGAMTFADPDRTVPEAARVLRPGGLLVFSTANPIRALAESRPVGRMTRQLRFDYFDLDRLVYGDNVEFQRPFGGWIALFRANGFEVLSLTELQAPARGRSTYTSPSDHRWARRWPMEAIWKLRKQGPLANAKRGRAR